MTPLAGQPVLTAVAMRAAEESALAQGATADKLMRRAGEEIAAVVLRLAAGSPVLVLCGPGNNGGVGYAAAARLRALGHPVTVAAHRAPRSDATRGARAWWTGAVDSLDTAPPAPVLIDALFGTGLSRELDQAVVEPLVRLRDAASLAIAIDLPSGLCADKGAVDGEIPAFDLTLALGAAKPAHLLQPAASRCGTVRILDIGVPCVGDDLVLDRPSIPDPGPTSHKYSRGMVAIIGGAMPGAAELASLAALRAGAGYALLLADSAAASPHAIVRRPFTADSLDDRRIGAVVIGPGLGRGASAAALLDAALATQCPLVVDGDALPLLGDRGLARVKARAAPVILTPHAGEFDTLFGAGKGSKIERARRAAGGAGAVVVFKGADTVIASPAGPVRLAPPCNPWLSTAGTGDVLAGTIAAMLAAGLPAFDAAAAGVWLHAAAARRLGAAFIADDLAEALTAARAAL